MWEKENGEFYFDAIRIQIQIWIYFALLKFLSKQTCYGLIQNMRLPEIMNEQFYGDNIIEMVKQNDTCLKK